MVKTLLFAAAALFVFTAPLAAQTATNVAPETRRAVVDEFDDTADRPSAPIRVVIPARAASVTPELPEGDDELFDAPPVEELPVDPVVAAPVRPTFFGVTVGGRSVFVLDRSGSMGLAATGIGAIEDHNDQIISSPTRMQVLKAEVCRTLNNMSEGDYFGLISFGSYPNTTAEPFMLEATPSNIKTVMGKVQALIPAGATPTKAALDLAMRQYGSEINSMFLLSDGLPTGTGHQSPSEILTWFPTAFAPMAANGCQFVSIHMGPQDDGGMQFMQGLANSVDGMFQHR